MNKVMIALVGGQPLPNFIPVRTEQPATTLFVYSDKTKNVYDKLESGLKGETRMVGLQTDAYKIPEIEQAILDWLQQEWVSSADSIIFNVTGGTKAMSLALYRIAEKYKIPILYVESEKGNKNRIYYYHWENGFELEHDKLIDECITLDDFLNLYFGRGMWQEGGSKRQEGSPFEEAIAAVLRQSGYEVKLGVKAMGSQIDIDVMIRYENQVGIIEAKLGKVGTRLDGIKQLNNAARQLGLFTRAFYVITVPPEESHSTLVAASAIQVISLPGFTKESEALTPDDAAELVKNVDKKFKG